MIEDILFSLVVPICAWIAYSRLQYQFSQPAFRWAMAHLIALGWIQLGSQIFLFLGMYNIVSMSLWLGFSLAWFRPTSLPRCPEMGLYLFLIPYFLLACVPPWYRDSLTYHLTLPKLFTLQQTYTAGDEIIFGYFPLGWHSILSSLFVFSPDQTTPFFNPRLISVWLTGAIAIGSAGLCQMLGGSRFWSWICGISFVLIPTQIEFGTSCYVQTWLTLICICAAGVTYEKKSIWMGLCAGLAASAKYSGLFLCFLLCITMIRKKERWKFLATMILVGAPFYIRNLWNKGNPLFPLAYSIFGGEGWDEARAEGYAHTLQNYGMGRELWDFLLLWPRVFLTQDMVFFFQGSLGPTIALICLWAIKKKNQHPDLFILGFGWFFLWMFQVQQIRFLMPAIPILMALGLSHHTKENIRTYTTGGTILASMMIWIFVPFQGLTQSLHSQAKPLYDSPITFLWKRQHTSQHLKTPYTPQEMNEIMHSNITPIYKRINQENIEKIWLVWSRGFTYPLHHPFRVDNVFGGWRWEQALLENRNIEEWIIFLKEEGISHLLINHRFFLHQIETKEEQRQHEAFQKLISAGVVRLVTQEKDMILYVVEPESESDSDSGGLSNPQYP
jgi:hypothetical protein